MCRRVHRVAYTKISSTFYNSICLFIYSESTYWAVTKWYIFVCTAIIIAFMQTFGIIVDWSLCALCSSFFGWKGHKTCHMCNGKTRLWRQIARFVELSQSKHLDDEYRMNAEISTLTHTITEKWMTVEITVQITSRRIYLCLLSVQIRKVIESTAMLCGVV